MDEISQTLENLYNVIICVVLKCSLQMKIFTAAFMLAHFGNFDLNKQHLNLHLELNLHSLTSLYRFK